MTPVKLGVYVSGHILQKARGQVELACILAHLCDPGQVTSLLSEPQFLHLETRKDNTVVPPLWGFGGMCVVLSPPAGRALRGYCLCCPDHYSGEGGEHLCGEGVSCVASG